MGRQSVPACATCATCAADVLCFAAACSDSGGSSSAARCIFTTRALARELASLGVSVRAGAKSTYEKASALRNSASAALLAPQEVVKAMTVAVDFCVQLRATETQPSVHILLLSNQPRTSLHRKKTASTVHSPSGGTPAV